MSAHVVPCAVAKLAVAIESHLARTTIPSLSLYTKKINHVYPLHHAAAGVAVANNRVWVALDQ